MENTTAVLVYVAGIITGIVISYVFYLVMRSRLQAAAHETDLMRAHLDQLMVLVRDFDRERQQQYGNLAENLQALSHTTHRLQSILANERQRGAWGEQIAAGILQAAGFIKDTHYSEQKALFSSDGTEIKPDFTFYLPNGLSIHMDVKFPFNKYREFFDAPVADAQAREQYLKQFVRDVKEKIKETSRYITNDSLAFALMFIPNETVFHFLNDQPEIREKAVTEGVVICSPLSFLIILAIIRQTSEAMAIDKSLTQVRSVLVKLKSDILAYADEMQELEAQLETMRKTVGKIRDTRAKQLTERVADLNSLMEARNDLIHEDDGTNES